MTDLRCPLGDCEHTYTTLDALDDHLIGYHWLTPDEALDAHTYTRGGTVDDH